MFIAAAADAGLATLKCASMMLLIFSAFCPLRPAVYAPRDSWFYIASFSVCFEWGESASMSTTAVLPPHILFVDFLIDSATRCNIYAAPLCFFFSIWVRAIRYEISLLVVSNAIYRTYRILALIYESAASYWYFDYIIIAGSISAATKVSFYIGDTITISLYANCFKILLSLEYFSLSFAGREYLASVQAFIIARWR